MPGSAACAPSHAGAAASTWTPEHGEQRWRRARLYCAERLKAVTPVQGNVSWIGGFQIRWQFVAITSLERIRHQCIAVTSSLIRRVHANEWQVPMRLARVVLRHLLEDGATRFATSRRGRARHEFTQPIFVGMYSGRQP